MVVKLIEDKYPIENKFSPLIQKAEPVLIEDISSFEIQEIIDELISIKRKYNGAGLAANQIGILKRIFIVEVQKNNPRYPYKPEIPLTIVINPEISFLTEETFENYEGCLSLPNIRGKVKRCPIIEVKGYNRKGKKISFITKGISAGTFQHELDHLNGVLFLDKVFDKQTIVSWDIFNTKYKEEFIRYLKGVISKYGS